MAQKKMLAKDILRGNKTDLHQILTGDYSLILNKVHEKRLITDREYNNLKGIFKENKEGHVVELVDKIIFKGESICQSFLELLQKDQAVKSTFPDLSNLKLDNVDLPPLSISETCLVNSNDGSPVRKMQKMNEQYEIRSQTVKLCVIINNEKFPEHKDRRGTKKDAESLANVFTWLGFRVLVANDQTQEEMDRTLKCISGPCDVSELQKLKVREFLNGDLINLQEAPKHGDAFVCCILTHGEKGLVYGVDSKSLRIGEITRTFKGTAQSALLGKPKVFLIQACQGITIQRGVLQQDHLAEDSSPRSIPEDADILVAMATVEDCAAMRHTKDGSWFIQSVCEQLKEHCPRGEDIVTILHRVNREVSDKEGHSVPGVVKQMPEVRSTLRKTLVLSPTPIATQLPRYLMS